VLITQFKKNIWPPKTKLGASYEYKSAKSTTRAKTQKEQKNELAR
jgi:hypothetical protein